MSMSIYDVIGIPPGGLDSVTASDCDNFGCHGKHVNGCTLCGAPVCCTRCCAGLPEPVFSAPLAPIRTEVQR